MAQTVQRAIDILEFCSIQPRTLKEISDMCAVHRTTALRLLHTLESGGFVRKDQRGRYGVGFRLAALSQSALEQFDLRTLVHHHIVDLSERVGQTVQFAVRQGGHIVYVDKIEPANSIHLDTRIGGYVVVHTAGVSKAILAHLPPQEVEEFLENTTFEQFTDNTLPTRADLEERLVEVRERGWSYDDGEYEAISNCVAAPVWDFTGNVAGAISITAIKGHTNLDGLRQLLPELLATTEAVSRDLGYLTPAGEPVTDIAGA